MRSPTISRQYLSNSLTSLDLSHQRNDIPCFKSQLWSPMCWHQQHHTLDLFEISCRWWDPRKVNPCSSFALSQINLCLRPGSLVEPSNPFPDEKNLVPCQLSMKVSCIALCLACHLWSVCLGRLFCLHELWFTLLKICCCECQALLHKLMAQYSRAKQKHKNLVKITKKQTKKKYFETFEAMFD